MKNKIYRKSRFNNVDIKALSLYTLGEVRKSTDEQKLEDIKSF